MKFIPLLAILALIIQTLSADTAINSLGGTSPVVYVDAGSLSDPYYNFYFVENSNENKGTVGEGYIPLKIASNETMSLIVGETYIFRRLNDQTSHPFFVTDDINGGMPSSKITLKAISSGNSYPWPSSSNGAAGLVEMEVTINDTFDPSTDSLYFICTSHPSMKDTFNTVTAANINTGSYGLGLKPNGLETSGSYNTSWPSDSPWTTALRLFESEDADSANEHTLKINVTSLGSGPAQYRLARTNKGGNFWYQNAQTLTEGVNTIPIGGVTFPRDIVIHFKNQDIGISSIELNGNLLAGFDPMPVIIPDAINDVPAGSVLADASQGFTSISSAGYTLKKSITTNDTDDKVAMGGITISYYVTKVSEETQIRTVKATKDNVGATSAGYYASVPSYEKNTIITQDCIDSAIAGTYSLKEIEAFQSDDDPSNDSLTISDIKGAPSPKGLKVEIYISGVNFNNRTIALQHSRIIAIDEEYGIVWESNYNDFDEAQVLADGSSSPFNDFDTFIPTTNPDFPFSFEGINMSNNPDDVPVVLDNTASQGVITFNINVTHLPYSGNLTYDIIKSSEGGWAEATGDGTNQNQSGTLSLGDNVIKVAGTTFPRTVLLRVSSPFGYSSSVDANGDSVAITASSNANAVTAPAGSVTTFNDSTFIPGTNALHPYIYKLASSNVSDTQYANNQEQKRIYINVTALPDGGATYNISKSLENLDQNGNLVYDVTQSGELILGMNAILLKSSAYDRTATLRISDNIAYDYFESNTNAIVGTTKPTLGAVPTLNINMVENENDSELKDARLTWNSKSFFLTGSSDLENWDYVSGGGGFFKEVSASKKFYKLSD